ncbi:MAG: polysaccharide biosynthesis tyrosine autokinase [Anaerolineae bacterium]|nr:polysaccharide biosynthesis tyrosine autokinase [Phycisphaerae bacterium]
MTQFSRNTKTDFLNSEVPSQQSSDAPRRNPLLSIWMHRWIVLGTMAIVVAAAIIHLYRAERIYQATARLTVERSGPRVVANDPSELMGQAQNFLNTQCEVLKSRKIFLAIAEDKNIQAMKTFEGRSDAIVGYLKGTVNAAAGKRDDIIAVSVKSPVPSDAAYLANAIVAAYKADLETQKKSSIRLIIDFFGKEKREVEKKLAAARGKKIEMQTKHGDLALGGQRSSPLQERVSRLWGALTEVQLEIINAQAAYDSSRTIASDPQKIRQLLDSRTFKSENADLRRQMREMQQRFAMVGKTYLPNFPELGVMQQSIKQLEQELQVEDKRVFDAYVVELESILVQKKNNAAQLQALLDLARSEALAQHSVASQFEIIASECQSLEKYDSDLASRIRELSPLSDEAMVNVNIVEDARASDAGQVEPNVATTMNFAIIGGLFMGALLAVGRDFLDQRLRSAEEIKQATGLPVLGVIPHIAGALTPAQRAQTLHIDSMSDVAEGYRTVRTAVYFGVPAGTAKTLLITSPSPGEGKSTLASNLAIAMAQAGNRILLLDADFRKPTQQKVWEIDRSIGLSNVLAGNQTLDEAIRPTAVPGLDVLPCGPIPANPSEILNSQMFADVLAEVAQRYDHVLLDSPPVMPVTDARILAASADATLLAVRAEKTQRKAAIFARDVLRSVGARLLGVVVNDVPRRKGLYGYYYSDAQLYRYGYGAQMRPRTAATDGVAVGSTNGAGNGNGSTAVAASVVAPTLTSSKSAKATTLKA